MCNCPRDGEDLLESVNLIPRLRKLFNGPQGPLGDRRPTGHVGQGQNMLLDLGREAEHAHDLGYPCAGDALTAGDGRLVGDFAGFDEGLPLDGPAEKFDDTGRPRFPERLRFSLAGRHSVYDPVGGHPAREATGVAVFEGPLGPQSDLDCLLVVCGYGAAVRPVQGNVDNAEPNFRLSPSRMSASRTVTVGEPFYFPRDLAGPLVNEFSAAFLFIVGCPQRAQFQPVRAFLPFLPFSQFATQEFGVQSKP